MRIEEMRNPKPSRVPDIVFDRDGNVYVPTYEGWDFKSPDALTRDAIEWEKLNDGKEEGRKKSKDRDPETKHKAQQGQDRDGSQA